MGTFGEKLKKEREQRSISLDDISLSTKIGTRLLRALEEERFDQLPGGIFNKGFVRAYARHVGLDEERAIADYMAALGESQVKAATEAGPAKPAPTPEPRRLFRQEKREDQPSGEIPWTTLAMLLLLIALAFASWNYYHREQVAETRNASNPPVGEASTAPHPNAALTGASVQNTQSSAPASSASPTTGTFTVLLKGNDDSEGSWLSIAVDGQPATEITLSAPTQKEVQATKEIVIKAGSVGAVDFYFNGNKLPTQGGYGVVKTLIFHPDGLQPAPKPATVPAAVPAQ